MRYLVILFLLISAGAQAQWKNYIIGPKGDTLNRVDAKGVKQGPWVIHIDELRGEKGYEEEGYFLNGLREGSWRRFSLEGDLIAVENYRWGNKDGKSIYMDTQGNPIREESWRSFDPANPYDTIDIHDIDDPTKVVGKKVIKVDGVSYKHGTWKYYDGMTGAIAKTENWYMNKPAVKQGDELVPIAVSDNGQVINSDTTTKKKVIPKPQAILDYEKKNANKKKIKVRDGQTGY
jgi:antitoxin component YwqK of YwqJK toxin-antitoxin module